MITVYDNGTQPTFSKNNRYIYVVNKIDKIPEGFDTLDKSLYWRLYRVKQGNNLIIDKKEFMYLQYAMLDYFSDYTLVMNGVFTLFDTIKLSNNDFNFLKDKFELISVDGDKIIWNDIKDFRSVYEDIMNACNYGTVRRISDKKLFYSFGVKLFTYFKNVNIYTAYFEGQLLKYLFDISNVTYNLISDTHDKLDVKIVDNTKLDTLGETYKSFNNNWVNSHLGKIMANPLYNIIRKIKKEGKSVVWTTFDNNYTKVSSNGCKKLYKSMNDTSRINADVGFFIANPFIDKYIKNYFDNNIDEDKYALSTLLRFLYTTNVKELYLPSSRMKKLLNDFLI